MIVLVPFVVAVAVPVMMVAAQQPRARNVHQKPEHRDRNSFREPDRYRLEQPHDALVGDQQSDHGQDDGAAEPRKIADLPGPERETGILRVLAGIGIGDGREQQRARVGRHVQTIRHQRQRPEQAAADDLGHHHDAAEPDDCPGFALVVGVTLAQKHMIVAAADSRICGHGHPRSLISGRCGPCR